MQQHFPDSLVIQISLLQGMTLHPQPVIAVSPQIFWKNSIFSLFYVKVYGKWNSEMYESGTG